MREAENNLGGWISVFDDLPENGVIVNVVIDGHVTVGHFWRTAGARAAITGQSRTPHTWKVVAPMTKHLGSLWGGMANGRVTHWQLLPAPPSVKVIT